MTRVVHVTEQELRAQLDTAFARYPEMRAIAAQRLGCCAVDRVADEYGWGDATDTWVDVEGALFLLGDDR